MNPQAAEVLKYCDAIVVALDSELRPCFASELTLRLLGYPSLAALRQAPRAEVLARFDVWDEHGHRLAVTTLPFAAVLDGRSVPPVSVHIHFSAALEDFYLVLRFSPLPRSEGDPWGVAVVAHDVTEVRKSEARLHRFRRIVAHTADHVSISARDGTIEYVNPAFERVTGYPAHEVVGHTSRILKSGEQGEPFYHHLWQTILAGQTFRTVFVNRRKNGEHYYDEKTITPLLDEHGEVGGFIAIGRDVTKRITREVAVARYNQELEDLNAELRARNDDLNAYARTVAHDLKNPLAVVRGYAELLQEESHDLSEEELHHAYQTIAAKSRKLTTIINELLLLAQVRQVEVALESLDMARLAEEALRRYDAQIAETGAQIAFPESWPMAVGYAPWIEEVWANYLSNALKYGGASPVIELGGDRMKDKGYSVFWVQDRGPGLSEQEVAQLFETFSPMSRQGHGLGLSIVKRIVAKLGGWVSAQCAEGEGCRFLFALPVTEGAVDE